MVIIRQNLNCKDREKVAIYKPRREASEETSSANTLILNF